VFCRSLFIRLSFVFLLAIVLSVFWPLCCLSFGHCVVCLLAIVLSALLRFAAFDYPFSRGSRGRDRMVVVFTTTSAISAYHHKSCEFAPRSWRGVLDTTLCDKVCQWLATGRWFSPYTPYLFSISKLLYNDSLEVRNQFVYTTFFKLTNKYWGMGTAMIIIVLLLGFFPYVFLLSEKSMRKHPEIK
jgi:hypothetical protein